MKKLWIIVLLMSFGVMSWAQTKTIPINEKTKKITFQGVIQVEGSQAELYERCVDTWLGKAYKNPSGVVESKSAQEHSVKGKHVIYMECADAFKSNCPIVNYKFTVETRDGRVRYILTDFTLKAQSLFPIETWMDKEDKRYVKAWDDYLDQIATFAEEWASTLESAIQPAEVFEEEEW